MRQVLEADGRWALDPTKLPLQETQAQPPSICDITIVPLSQTSMPALRHLSAQLRHHKAL